MWESYAAGGASHSFRYDGTTYTTLDVPGAYATTARGIDGGNIAGYYGDGSGVYRGFRYDGTTYTRQRAGGIVLFANDIDGSNIVGNYMIGGYYRGFRYDGTTYTPLSVPGGLDAGLTG